MNEPNTEGTEGTPAAVVDPATAPAASGTDRPALERALAKQAADFQTRDVEKDKKIAAYESEKLKSKEAKLKADGDLQKLLDARDATIKDQAAIMAMDARKHLSTKAEKILRGLGMTDDDRLELYSVTKLPVDTTLDTVAEWANQIKIDNPGKFTTPATPIKSGDAGDPSINAAGADLASRLLSPDNAVRAAAFKEQLQSDLSGGA